MNKEEAIKKVNEIKEEYAKMDGLKDYVEALDTVMELAEMYMGLEN